MALLAAALVLAFAASASGASDLAAISDYTHPPPGHRLNGNQVLAIARALPKIHSAVPAHRGAFPVVYEKGPYEWQVSWFDRRSHEIAQVLIDDQSARVLEAWTGFQVAWSMARGYPGAFGRKSNALYVWIPLSLLFIAPFFDRRRPLRILHLDLLVLLSFSISLAFFNNADIYRSVPLAYPPLVYLAARLLWVGLRRSADPQPLRLAVPASWLVVGLVFLLGFRIGLNITDSNVIDVGYAGVIGAHRIVVGEGLYGQFPTDNPRGDTYGPVAYEAYVPFERIFGFSGHWDDLPAAHAASVAFDLLCVLLLFLIGRQIRGPTLGVALAYAWAAYPFTLFAMNSNTNDSLVGALLLLALLLARSPAGRGIGTALAGLTKFAPLAVAPLFATHGLWEMRRAASRARAVATFAIAFAATAALALVPVFVHGSLHAMWQRTVVYQADRGSPFSIWGLYGGLNGAQAAVQIAAVLLAIGVAVIPRRRDLIGLAALAGAVVIAVQLGVTHWFYLYIPWFLGLALVALVGRHQDLIDGVSSHPARGADHDSHHPGVLVGG
jgi:hypothetical protein